MSGTKPEVVGRGALSAAISNAMVGLLHRYTGRGPTRARTTIGEDVIACVMGATLTKAEQSLVLDGKHEVVLHGRRAFQDTMRVEAIAAVQELSERRVVAFMSTNHIDPDLAVEVFILAPEAGDELALTGSWLDGHDGNHGHDGRDGHQRAGHDLDGDHDQDGNHGRR